MFLLLFFAENDNKDLGSIPNCPTEFFKIVKGEERMTIVLLSILPTIFASILCFAVHNAIPAIIVGGLCLVITILSFLGSTSAIEEDAGGLGIFIVITIPAFVNSFILGMGTIIYYIAR